MTTKSGIQFELGDLMLTVRDYRPERRAVSSHSKFYIPRSRFKQAGEKLFYYVRRDTNEVIEWDRTDGDGFAVADLTPDQAMEAISKWADKRTPRKPQPLTVEQRAELDAKRAEVKAKAAERQRHFHVDVFVLAGCEESDVEAAIDEIGMPNGCADRRAFWLAKMCRKLNIDVSEQPYIRNVLCGRQ